MNINKPTIDDLRQFFRYDAELGQVFWLQRPHKMALSVSPGMRAGCTKADGYRYIRLIGSQYFEHRLAWALHYAEWPSMAIDHINGMRADNRIANLRLASFSINNQNHRTPHKRNKLGVLGVRNLRGRYTAQIMVEGKRVHLGSFGTVDAARQAYINAKRKFHEGCTL